MIFMQKKLWHIFLKHFSITYHVLISFFSCLEPKVVCNTFSVLSGSQSILHIPSFQLLSLVHGLLLLLCNLYNIDLHRLNYNPDSRDETGKCAKAVFLLLLAKHISDSFFNLWWYDSISWIFFLGDVILSDQYRIFAHIAWTHVQRLADGWDIWFFVVVGYCL